jgi:hypothetical protein
MTARFFGLALLILLSFPGQTGGQNVSVDENAFRIYLNGEEVGREEFSIRQIGSGAPRSLILRGDLELNLESGAVFLAPAMAVQGDELSVSTYQVKVTGAEATDVYVNVSGNRYLSRVVSEAGEQLREYRAGPGSVLLDEDVVHHHYLLGPFLQTEQVVSLSVLSPRAARQERMTLSFWGEEEIRVGGILVQGARRYHLAGGGLPRDIWFDDQGRILRLEIPSLGYVAERESLT